MKTTARLTSTLRRLLDAQSTAQHIRLAAVLRDIKQAALELNGRPHAGFALNVLTDTEITSPLARTFWKASPNFDEQMPAEHFFDANEVRKIAGAFAKLQRLDFRKMRRTIREATCQGQAVTLAQLHERSAIAGGVVELLGYLQIAHDDRHQIDTNHTETITIQNLRHHGNPLVVRVPHVLFLSSSPTSTPSRKPK